MDFQIFSYFYILPREKKEKQKTNPTYFYRLFANKTKQTKNQKPKKSKNKTICTDNITITYFKHRYKAQSTMYKVQTTHTHTNKTKQTTTLHKAQYQKKYIFHITKYQKHNLNRIKTIVLFLLSHKISKPKTKTK